MLRLVTDRGDLLTRTIVIAGGHGAFEPRRLTDFDVTPWEGRGATYLVGDKSALAGKNVVIVGGGDSAFDWALNLVDTAATITLVHRRDRFRAHESTIAAVRESGRVEIKTPYRLSDIRGHDRIESVTISGDDGDVDLPCDALLLQLGFKTALGPLADWPLGIDKGSIVVDPRMKTTMDGVWAAGDVTTFDGKLKLIATGFAEAATAVSQAVLSIRPDERLQPGYSTNTGVPGVVDGQV